MIVTGLTAAEHALDLLDEHPAGWSLPQPFYTDESFFVVDVEHVIARQLVVRRGTRVRWPMPETGCASTSSPTR